MKASRKQLDSSNTKANAIIRQTESTIRVYREKEKEAGNRYCGKRKSASSAKTHFAMHNEA